VGFDMFVYCWLGRIQLFLRTKIRFARLVLTDCKDFAWLGQET